MIPGPGGTEPLSITTKYASHPRAINISRARFCRAGRPLFAQREGSAISSSASLQWWYGAGSVVGRPAHNWAGAAPPSSACRRSAGRAIHLVVTVSAARTLRVYTAPYNYPIPSLPPPPLNYPRPYLPPSKSPRPHFPSHDVFLKPVFTLRSPAVYSAKLIFIQTTHHCFLMLRAETNITWSACGMRCAVYGIRYICGERYAASSTHICKTNDYHVRMHDIAKCL